MPRTSLDSVEIEVSVLSAIFARPANLWIAAEIIKPDFFRDSRNRTVFDAMMKLAVSGNPFDYAATRQKLKEDGNIARVTEAHLSALDDTFADTSNVEYFSRKVAEEHVRFEAIKTANTMKADLESGKNVKETLDLHQATMIKLHGNTDLGGAVHISEPVIQQGRF